MLKDFLLLTVLVIREFTEYQLSVGKVFFFAEQGHGV